MASVKEQADAVVQSLKDMNMDEKEASDFIGKFSEAMKKQEFRDLLHGKIGTWVMILGFQACPAPPYAPGRGLPSPAPCRLILACTLLAQQITWRRSRTPSTARRRRNISSSLRGRDGRRACTGQALRQASAVCGHSLPRGP